MRKSCNIGERPATKVYDSNLRKDAKIWGVGGGTSQTEGDSYLRPKKRIIRRELSQSDVLVEIVFGRISPWPGQRRSEPLLLEARGAF